MKISFIILSFLLCVEVFAIDKFCSGAPTVVHANGGGNVAITSIVASTAYVGPNASVCEFAVVLGTSEVRDNSRVYGNARITNGTIVSGNSQVFGNAIIISDGAGCSV